MKTLRLNSSSASHDKIISSNTVVRNTYMLLSMTLVFSGAIAGLSMLFNLPHPGILLTLVGYFGLLFFTSKYKNQSLGLFFVFALTGFMGYTLGPILNTYLALINGAQIIMLAMSSTGVIFIVLSAYAVSSKKDFSFMGGFLLSGIIVAFLAGLGAIFFEIPSLSLVVSSLFVLLMAGLILYETSRIVHGGETNYIMATVTLFVAIFNLLTSLLHVLGAFMGNSDN